MARHALIQNMWSSLKFESEFSLKFQLSLEYGIRKLMTWLVSWVTKKSWAIQWSFCQNDGTLRSKQTSAHQYSFVESMHPENIIKEKKKYSSFVFKNFMQEYISGVIDETLKNTCLFHYNEADEHGINSALVAMPNLKRHFDFWMKIKQKSLCKGFKRKRGAEILSQKELIP